MEPALTIHWHGPLPRGTSTSEAVASPVPHILAALRLATPRRLIAAGLTPTDTCPRTLRDETRPPEKEQLADDQPAETA